MLDQALFGQRLPSSSGHRCRSNLWVRYRSPITASPANWAGVKNLCWHLVHDASVGTLPSSLKTTKLRSTMTGTVGHRSKLRAIFTSSRMHWLLPQSTSRSRGISKSSTCLRARSSPALVRSDSRIRSCFASVARMLMIAWRKGAG